MKGSGSFFILLFLCLCLFFPAHATADGITVDVKGRVQLTLPANWEVKDADFRKMVRDAAEHATGTRYTNDNRLIAASLPVPSYGFVRVSFMNGYELSQEYLRSLSAQEKEAFLSLLRPQVSELRRGLERQGIQIIGDVSIHFGTLGGKTAIVTSYARSHLPIMPESWKKSAMRVVQYQVPLGTEIALITFSYDEKTAAAVSDYNAIRLSASIR